MTHLSAVTNESLFVLDPQIMFSFKTTYSIGFDFDKKRTLVKQS